MDPRHPHYFGPMKGVADQASATLECGHSYPGRAIRGKRARCPLCAVAWRRANIGPEAPDYWSEVADGLRPFRHEEVGAPYVPALLEAPAAELESWEEEQEREDEAAEEARRDRLARPGEWD